MKKLILGSVAALAAISSLSAHAVTASFCNGGVAMNSPVTATSGPTRFVKVAFTPKCSANVFLVGDDFSPTVYRVGSASVKGKTRFNGSTIGGSVGVNALCGAAPTNTCVLNDAALANNAAPTQ